MLQFCIIAATCSTEGNASFTIPPHLNLIPALSNLDIISIVGVILSSQSPSSSFVA